MDGQRIDRLTKALAARATRRGLFAGLAGLAVGVGSLCSCALDQTSRCGLGRVC